MTPRIAAIAAMSKNRVIGRDNQLPWHIPEDFKHFKRTTMGKPVIMGRKTYESLGKPLPGRVNIVISRNPDDIQGDVFAVDTLDKAIERAKAIAAADKVDEIFIIGGGQIYEAALPQTDRLYLTIIDEIVEGDAYFPTFDESAWQEISTRHYTDPVPYDIKVFERKE